MIDYEKINEKERPKRKKNSYHWRLVLEVQLNDEFIRRVRPQPHEIDILVRDVLYDLPFVEYIDFDNCHIYMHQDMSPVHDWRYSNSCAVYIISFRVQIKYEYKDKIRHPRVTNDFSKLLEHDFIEGVHVMKGYQEEFFID